MSDPSIPTPPLLGGGRYRVDAVLGDGAQGTTFQAVDSRDGRAVAIKRLRVRGAHSWKDVELAEREVRVLASLDHPLIPRYYEHFEEDGALYLVMERVEGESLEAIRRREGPLSEREARRLLVDLDRTLTYLHGRAEPVVHRDIKPGNVVRRPNGSYVLVDFGAVSELLRRQESGSTVVGTYGYMAPEQLQGRAGPASDVYAIGATAIAALSGKEPEDLPHRGLHLDVSAALGGAVSPELCRALWRMVEPDPDQRPSNIAVALDEAAAPASGQALGRAPGHAPGPAPSHAPGPAPLYAYAPAAPTPAQPAARSAEETAALRSTRKLLWLLWGLGWILVPLVFGAVLDLPILVPLVMFGSLAALFIVTWNDNAILGRLMRRANGRPSVQEQQIAAAPGLRFQSQPEPGRVRVNTANLRPDEVVGQTEAYSLSEAPEQRRMRR